MTAISVVHCLESPGSLGVLGCAHALSIGYKGNLRQPVSVDYGPLVYVGWAARMAWWIGALVSRLPAGIKCCAHLRIASLFVASVSFSVCSLQNVSVSCPSASVAHIRHAPL